MNKSRQHSHVVSPTAARATAALGYRLVEAKVDTDGNKGVCLLATCDIEAGHPLLVEAPLLLVPPGSFEYNTRMQSLLGYFSADSEEQLLVVRGLTLQKARTIRAFAEAPANVREEYKGLQSKFSETSTDVAKAVAKAAAQLHEAELFRGRGGNLDGIFAGGATLSENDIREVLSCALINGFDFQPEGSEAYFYHGSLFEHSCVPNVQFYMVPHPDEGKSKKKNAAPTRWIGEWRAMRTIKKGEACCISYLEKEILAKDVGARHEKLLKRMSFRCLCERCASELSQATISPGLANTVCQKETKQVPQDAKHVPQEAPKCLKPLGFSWADLKIASMLCALNSKNPLPIKSVGAAKAKRVLQR